jgi:Domain of unknown function (DUF1707)
METILNVPIRPTRADRDYTLDQLRQGANAGLLDAAELEERLNAAYLVMTLPELFALVADLPPPMPQRTGRVTRGQKGMLAASALFIGVLITVAVVATNSHAAPVRQPGTSSTPVPASNATAASPADLNVAIVPAGQFSHHDPADECGAFGPTTVIGSQSCYLVVQFTNTSSSPVNVVPADLNMVDQNGTSYSVAPVSPQCYDRTGVDTPSTLTPRRELVVQLCYPVSAGALPQRLLGTEALGGLVVTVPSEMVNGKWGES